MVKERKEECIEFKRSRTAVSIAVVSAGTYNLVRRRVRGVSSVCLETRIFFHVRHLVNTLAYSTAPTSALNLLNPRLDGIRSDVFRVLFNAYVGPIYDEISFVPSLKADREERRGPTQGLL